MSEAMYFRYWGKAERDGQHYHLLPYHCLDVAAVAAAWWDASQVIRRIFHAACDHAGLGEQQLRALVLFFISLHDIGKFDVRFQFKAPDALSSCWPDLNLKDVEYSKKYDHGGTGYLLSSKEHKELFKSADFSALRPWLLAVTGHHGELPDNLPFCDIYPTAMDYVITHDQEARQQFVEAMKKLFLEPAGYDMASLPLVATPSFPLLLAGFCSVSDWIGSNAEEGGFSYRETASNLKLYFEEQLDQVVKRQLLTKFGLLRSSRPYAGVQSLLKEKQTPRGVQVIIDDLPSVPGLTLIEAPTGEGKTEAALAYAWRLLDAGLAESIVFALPTQATANAMLKRVKEFAEKLFAGDSANVVLAHGKRDFNHEFQRLVDAGRKATAQGRNDASTQCADWLAQSRKRIFLGQIGICTVDQVLLSVLPVRHKFVRGYGVNKSVLIVDEVHAYDSYMHGLLAEVVKRQHDAGGSAILLSATLPPMLRNELVALWGSSGSTSDDYPLITQATNAVHPFRIPKKDLPKLREVQVECLPLANGMPDENLLSRIIEAAEAGGRVAVIANLVDNAQEIATLLRDPARNPSCVRVDIFHARYRFRDRQAKEELALAEYGAEAIRGKGRILVATQVVEQSLDLDFDWMVTQICPVDLLFQRLGRLHRHKRKRPPGFEMPRCTIMTVVDFVYGLHEKIYENTRVLWRTENLLRKTTDISFPSAYRDWINEVYQRDEWDNEPENIALEFDAYHSLQLHRKEDAQRLTTMSMLQFQDEDARITSLTRDGEMSLTVVPILAGKRSLDGATLNERDEKNYAEEINLNSVPVPASWGDYLRDCQEDNDGRFLIEFAPSGEDSWVSSVKGKTLRYTREFGMAKK